MHDDDVILVTGATGNTGSTVLQQLEKRGAVVRALVRSANDAARLPVTSATAVVGNFDDARSLQAALEGATRAIWSPRRVRTPRRSRCDSQNSRQQPGVRRLVKLSQFAADEASPVRFLRYHAAVERRIR